jgi:hypothetical protein
LNFLDRHSKNTEIPKFMKIYLVGAELFHADGRKDGRTDMTKLIVAFRSVVKAPKNATLGKPEGRRTLGKPAVDGRVLIQWISDK